MILYCNRKIFFGISKKTDKLFQIRKHVFNILLTEFVTFPFNRGIYKYFFAIKNTKISRKNVLYLCM